MPGSPQPIRYMVYSKKNPVYSVFLRMTGIIIIKDAGFMKLVGWKNKKKNFPRYYS
jgi:hypothetical protein